MSAYVGALIRRARLARNLSQEGLAKGICAASYLSKIEKGQIEPGQEIVDRLFRALGIDFVRDPALEAQARRMLESFFFRAEADQPFEEERAFFEQHGERLSASNFALPLMAVRLCVHVMDMDEERARACWRELLPYMDCMDAALRRRALVAGSLLAETGEEALRLLEEAALLGEDCVAAYEHAVRLFRMGRYGRSTERAQRAYALACEEGNPCIMRASSFLLGLNACNHYDMEQAEAYYRRVTALCRGCAGADFSEDIRYNLGSTYLELGDDERAYTHLHGLGEQAGKPEHNILTHQKQALLCARRGEREEAAAHIARARAMLEDYAASPERRTLYEQMLRLPELMLGDDPLAQPETEHVLRALYEGTGDAFGQGFRQFYGRYLVQLYSRQRRYKEALRVAETLQPENLS